MIYGSVCSGIEAATVAWEPLGWRPAWFSEIEPFPSAVLAYHYPSIPNLGDFTKIGAEHGPIDLLVGGTPCQSFSVAGLRKGMADDRGNLALEFLRLADRLGPHWVVWENVPGVLSSNEGRDFGAFLGGLASIGYGWAYRILDAQYAGVPQRRRRVFLVGHSGGLWQRAAAVLFECHSLQGHPTPSREKGQRTAAGPNDGVAGSILTKNRMNATDETFGTDTYLGGEITPALDANYGKGPGGRGPAERPVVLSFRTNQTNAQGPIYSEALTDTLAADHPPAVMAFTERTRADGRNLEVSEDVAYALTNPGSGGRTHSRQLMQGSDVRRLTPVECERLQGFRDNWTLVPYRGKPAADGPRYRALGNSMAVPVMRWIGERIAMAEAAAHD